MWKVVSKGPPSLPGEYAKVKSRIVSKSLNPKFDQKFKLYLEGGNLSDHGVYQNHSAPFTMLRVQMFDNDKLSLDDFMGEIRVPLCPLMTCRTLEGWFDLEDPEGAYEEEEPVKGRVYLRLKWNRDCLLEGSLRPKGKQREIKISDLDSPLAPSRGMNVQNKFLDDEASIRNGIAVYTNSIPKHLNVKLGAARVEEGEKGASEGRETANVEIYSPAIKQKEEADAETPIDKMVKDKCKQVKDGLDLLEMKRNELHAKMNQMRSNLFNRTAAQQDESDWVKGVFTLDKSIDQVEEAPSNIEIRNALKQVQESSLLLRKRNMLLKQSLEKGRAQQRFELARTEDGMLTVVKADGDTESESLKEGDVVHAMQGQDVAIVTDAEVFSLLENHATVVVTVIRDSTTSLDLDVTASSLVLVDSQVAPSHASLSRSNTLVKELPNHDEVVVL
ncbi:hypothetical protein GUITHDRAFT_107875 [Guillardia theta CCMP2712]|uniref:C2 domain-containing protein n=2 Tax=Guillardia theta TaxID=55529 RepID=L1JDT9_GUITC|nr:hypothetical protein GUITHDRAFT_107875 [Guillardia theta CCMP2712]EKX46264.1 hypothetical protein GUITHDRAFT_107875 [Guillardia theta CCMP2712]|eukprot:XP_005833244.1 hypothetical protein GUITHDRAFT_107875 [Guillardia theta CCMP2712]